MTDAGFDGCAANLVHAEVAETIACKSPKPQVPNPIIGYAQRRALAQKDVGHGDAVPLLEGMTSWKLQAPLVRLERTTVGLEVRCSVH